MDPNVEAANTFAQEKHAGQFRKDGKTPYYVHCRSVQQLLMDAGVTESAVLQAAVLHDTREDTDTTHAELVGLFGQRVADIVEDLTNPPAIDGKRPPGAKRQHIESLRTASWEASLIKLADRYHNLTDMQDFDPAYANTYAMEGLRILAACLENKKKMPDECLDAKQHLAQMLHEEIGTALGF